jgi:hypothetical protein
MCSIAWNKTLAQLTNRQNEFCRAACQVKAYSEKKREPRVA